MDISQERQEYSQGSLSRHGLASNPFQQFETWFEQACRSSVPEPNAMSLATATAGGAPSLRTVLLKYFDQKGFVFFTNYESKKAKQIAENPQVALLFLWIPLERQIIIEGTAAQISVAESLNYFVSRPRGSQIGAWCSPQSRIISSRKLLEMQFEKMAQNFREGKIPLPSFWGGYCVTPHRFEFWQGRPNRLHDRFLYEQQADQSWQIHRLAP